MAQAGKILVDTDILIKVYRGDSKLRKILDSNQNNLAVSVITWFELMGGLKTRQRIIDLNKQMKAFTVIHLSEKISIKSLSLYQKYLRNKKIGLPDALIAATAIIHNLELLTDNRQDYDFINEMKLFEL
jgi:hypothetical protein